MVPIRNPFLNSPYIYFIFTGGVLLLKLSLSAAPVTPSGLFSSASGIPAT
uniref:Uncharacterized protein n=1 Tax=Brassica oleracea var. oleracea TaxID=109376 RepID=A0A0D3BIB4_BRAOL